MRSLFAEGGYDIYCAGSNAGLLSGELATYLSGRYIEIKVFCLSYNEFSKFHKLQNSPDAFLNYIKYGGLPYLINLELADDIVYDYLKNIYNTILFKDVVLSYLSHLKSAFFVLKVRRSEIAGKKIFEIGEKYYFEDLGLRHTIIGYRQADIGKILENLVFIHLKRSRYDVTVGRIGGAWF